MRIKIKGKFIRKHFFDTVKIRLNLSWREIYKKFGVPKSTFEKYKSGNLLMSEELFLSLADILDAEDKTKSLNITEKLPDNFGRIKGGKQAYLINFEAFAKGRIKGVDIMKRYRKNKVFDFNNINLSPQICEFIGAFIGDGCFNCYENKLYHIEFAGDSRYDLNYYRNIIIPYMKKVIPNINPHIYNVKSKSNTQRVVIYSKELFYFLRDYIGFIPGKKAHTIKIPNKIMQSSDENIIATIRGIFDTDGCVFLDKRRNYKNPYPRIALRIVSKPLYEQLKSHLSKYFDLYATFNEKRQIYIIEIYGINQVKLWMSLIGFSNKRHFDKLAPVAQW